LLRPLPIVSIDDAVRALAREIVASSIMPHKAAADALHDGAAVGGVQYLLTLHCTPIANARELPRIDRLLDERGFGQFLICTPAEFLGSAADEEPDPR